MSAIKMKAGGIYVTRCGSILRCDSAEGGLSATAEVICASMCEIMTHSSHWTSCARCESSQWSYRSNGQWMGAERDKDFHLHIVREVTP